MTDDEEIEIITIELDDDEPTEKVNGRRKRSFDSDDDESIERSVRRKHKSSIDSDDESIRKRPDKKHKSSFDSDDEPGMKSVSKKHMSSIDSDYEPKVKPVYKKRNGSIDSYYEPIRKSSKCKSLNSDDEEFRPVPKPRKRKKVAPLRERVVSKKEESDDDLFYVPDKSGFEFGFLAEKIIGITDYGDGGLKFLIKYKDREDMELIMNDKCRKHCPEMVIDFYEQHIQWKDRDV